MKKVITYGTFDLFHYGHLRLLERLRELGDHLTVAVSTDEFNKSKGKESVVDFSQRSHIVGALRCVDEVIAETCWSQKEADILSRNISVFGMGDDWEGHFDELRSICHVVYIPRTPGVSTSMIRHSISSGDT